MRRHVSSWRKLTLRPDDATQSRRRAPSPSQPSSHRRRNRERLRTEKSLTRRTTPRRSQCLRKRTPPALAMSVEPIGRCPNHEGEVAGIDVDCVAVYRLSVRERLDRNQVVPSRDQRIVLAALYLIVLVVDLLEVQCSYTDRDDAKDEQFALNCVPFAPTFWKWGTDRHEPSQRLNHMTVKGAFLRLRSMPWPRSNSVPSRHRLSLFSLLYRHRADRPHVAKDTSTIQSAPIAGISTQRRCRCVAVTLALEWTTDTPEHAVIPPARADDFSPRAAHHARRPLPLARGLSVQILRQQSAA